MTKFKMRILPVALMLLIIPCSLLLMACKGADSPLIGDWKLKSVTYVQEEEDLTVEVGNEVEEGVEVEESWLTLHFTNENVTINMAMDETQNLEDKKLSYEKIENRYETVAYTINETTVGKFVFTVSGDNLIVEQYTKTGDEGEFERVGNVKHFTVVKGTLDTNTEE